jgi:hypothetical protein
MVLWDCLVSVSRLLCQKSMYVWCVGSSWVVVYAFLFDENEIVPFYESMCLMKMKLCLSTRVYIYIYIQLLFFLNTFFFFF